MTSPDGLEPGLDAIAVLADPVRRSAYQVVVAANVALGRDEVAAELGVGRTLAAFHLDKLVNAGLLAVSYARRSGRTGPGAGRPAKLYQRPAGEHVVSVPPRAYRSAAELLAEAVERAGADAVLYDVARNHGRAAGRVSADADLITALTDQGYEPVAAGEQIRLRNCPFHRLATQFPPIVCGMNLALLTGLAEGRPWTAELTADGDHCCVSFMPSKNKTD